MSESRKFFHTFGARGIVNEDMTPDFVLGIGKALGTLIKQGKRVVIGHDPRTSSQMFKMALTAGILSSGVSVVDLGMIPIPILAYLTKKLGGDAGVMITASHNPPQWNGIKIFASDGSAFNRNQDLELEKITLQQRFKKSLWNSLGRVYSIDQAADLYIKDILKRFDVNLIKEANLKCAVDGGGGANSYIVPKLLGDLNCKVFTHNCIPDGFFRERNPEPKSENLQNFALICKATGVEVGIAYDSDGDRAVFLDEHAKILQGDRTFALSCYWALKESPRQTIVTNVATSSVIYDIAEMVDAKVELTPIGEPIIVKKMKETNAIVGGEENGGFIWRDWSWIRDGILSALVILELMVKENKSLSELDRFFPQYYQRKISIPCPREKYRSVMTEVGRKLPKDYSDLITMDGFRLNYTSHRWLSIRPSGTEPLIRVFSEAESESTAEEISSIGKEVVLEALQET